MEQNVFEIHQRLNTFPPAKLVYIVFRRLKEQGFLPTFLWIGEKIARPFLGSSPRRLSQVHPLLFIGGQHRKRGLRRMQAWGIRAVVNMREESDDAAHSIAGEHYLWLPTPDDAVPSLEALQRGAAFIAEQIAAGRGVYVHCAAGVGRAPLMGAAYLVTTGMTPAAAWQTIRSARPFIRPTPPQIEVIETFAASRTLPETTLTI
ncbi:MAG: dual specificity protein phosphatase family protein [Anaerolineae bacterium]|nr:dual specificity protein phosphatase family protein [Anaerolineae bacterium]